jgi:hypothetical protein
MTCANVLQQVNAMTYQMTRHALLQDDRLANGRPHSYGLISEVIPREH